MSGHNFLLCLCSATMLETFIELVCSLMFASLFIVLNKLIEIVYSSGSQPGCREIVPGVPQNITFY